METQVTILLLFHKNPEISSHATSVKITGPDVHGIEIYQSKPSCPLILQMGSYLHMLLPSAVERGQQT